MSLECGSVSLRDIDWLVGRIAKGSGDDYHENNEFRFDIPS